VRLNYSVREQDGFVNNAGSGERTFGAVDQRGWRADLLWQPESSLSVRLTADKSELDNSPQWVGKAPLEQGFVDRPSSSSPAVVDLKNNEVETVGESLTLEWAINEHTELRSITARREIDDFQIQIFHPGMVMGQPLIISDARGNQEQWSEELQLSGQLADADLDYVAGLLWFDEDIERAASNQLTARRQKVYVDGTGLRNESLAAYTHLGWSPDYFDGALRLTAGLRWSEDSREATVARAVEDLNTGIIKPQPVPGVGDRDFDNLSPTLGLEWHPDDATMVYLSVTDGYKSGGFNARASSTARFNEGFDDETLRSWEAGVKTRLWQQRLQLNLSIFHSNYEDIQVTVQSDAGNPVIVDVLNAGEATIEGLESSITAALTEQLSLAVEYAWLDTEFDTVRNANGDNVASRYRFLYAPKHHLVSRLRYQFPALAVGTPQAELQYSWQDDMYASDTATGGDYRIPAYGLLNARIALSEIELTGGQLEIAAWANNLLDEDYYTAHFNAGLPSAVWGEPQTLGVDIAFRY